MEGIKNGGNSTFLLNAAATLGIAAITGVIGWTFAHVVDLSSNVAQLEQAQKSNDTHATQQDKWIEELNRKMEANQHEIRDSIGEVTKALNNIQVRSDGKVKLP